MLESEPAVCGGVDWSYSVVEAPGPRSPRSSPYSKYACVGVPSGLTEPDTAAPLLVSVDGDPPDTAGGDDAGDAGGGEDGCGAL